jgi:F-type H+-transporting ATPase subunit delta
MNQSKISVRYAKALFNLAKETNSLDSLRNDSELLLNCISDVPELQFMIRSPVITLAEKIHLFKSAFRDSFSELTFKFINLVLENRREEHLAGMCRYFLHLLKAEQGIRSAEMVTAVPLNDALRQTISRLIARKFSSRIELHEKTDQAIVGGFILRVGDQQIDASILSKLHHIRTELINA